MIALAEGLDDDNDDEEKAIAFVHKLFSYSGQETKELVAQDIRRVSTEIEELIAAVDLSDASTDAFQHIRSCIDAASALRQYAEYNGQPVEVINAAAIAQLRAERTAGKWLRRHLAD